MSQYDALDMKLQLVALRLLVLRMQLDALERRLDLLAALSAL